MSSKHCQSFTQTCFLLLHKPFAPYTFGSFFLLNMWISQKESRAKKVLEQISFAVVVRI